MKGQGLEKIYNVFLFISDGVILEFGIDVYSRLGSDASKLAFLQSQVSNDYSASRRFPLPDRVSYVDPCGKEHKGRLSYEGFLVLQRNGQMTGLFEEVFAKIGASRDVLMCVTPIVNGKPNIQGVSDIQGGNVVILN